MKKNLWLVAAGLAIVASCTEGKKTEKWSKDTVMNHAQEQKNELMLAMDNSMMAMHHADQTGNADYDFVAMMIPHHQGAIEMAKILLENGKSDSLKKFSNKVIFDQDSEIKQLKTFLATASKTANKNASTFRSALNKSMELMMEGMGNAKLKGNADHDFIVLMVPHHQSAVAMAKAYLPYAANAQVKKIAGNIIRSQEQEIKWMKSQL